MRTSSTNLLHQLGSGVIPIDLPAATPRSDAMSFSAMLSDVQAGRIASGLPVNNAPDASFTQNDLELFARIADAAQAAGVNHVAVAIGSRIAIVNVEQRQAQEVPAVLPDQTITPGDIQIGIDGMVLVLREQESDTTPAEPGRQMTHVAQGRAHAIPMSHPAVAELLAGAETHRT